LDLGFDHGVLHVILQSLGVALTLLQNRLHDRVVLYDDQEAIEDQYRTLRTERRQPELTMILATSGSRMARSRACSSVSPCRCWYVSLAHFIICASISRVCFFSLSASVACNVEEHQQEVMPNLQML
jgi:hypothetical protein